MNILEECKGAKSIGISGHIRPDGDCVGSCVGMAMYLRKNMPEAQVDVFLDEPADIFDCIRDVNTILHEAKADAKYDVFMAIDCAAERFSFGTEMFDNAKKKINIDHHITNKGCGDVNYIFPETGSAAELVYEVMDKDKIDKDIALAIYIGIIHDTGVLQYQNTRPETLRTVADLISYGFDFPNIITSTFYEKTYTQTKILGKAILDCESLLDGRCMASMIDKATMDYYGATSKDFEGVANQLRNIRGVDCAIFTYELEENKYKVSLRTSEAVDAAAVTAVFDGGGHARAAGVAMSGSYQDILGQLLAEIKKQLG